MRNNTKTLTQEYAYYAFHCIKEVAKEEFKEKYASRVKKLPTMITHNGLLTTLTFLYSKAKFDENSKPKDENAFLLSHLVRWLKNNFENQGEYILISKDEIKEFLEKLTEMDFQRLMVNSRRALTLAQWLKRLAEGEFKDAKED